MKKINLDEIIGNGGGVSLSPFDIRVFCGVLNVLGNTDEGDFMTSEIFPAMGWEETPERREKVTESLRKMDAAGLLVIPEFHKGKREEAHTDRDRVTLAKNHVLTAIEELEKTDAYNSVRGIIGILENAEDGLADVLKDYELGNIEEAPIDDGDNLSWVVFAETRDAEHCGKFGAFETKSAAEKYAAALDADTNHEFSVTVEKIIQ